MTTQRKVLVVSYFFPPAGDVGVHRTLRFLKLLPEFGWQPIVLAPRNPKVSLFEPRLLDRVPPGVTVVRTNSFESLNHSKSTDNGRIARLPRLLTKLFVEFPRDAWKFCAVPDDKIGWIPGAVSAASRVIREQKIDAIYVSGKPFSSFWIGHFLSKRFGVPWVMDLRDLWALNRRIRPKSLAHQRLERWMERTLVRSAAIVVANTPGNRRDFVKHYPDGPSTKFVTITNGYDRDDFAAIPETKFDRFTIAYTGTFYFQPVVRNARYRRLLGFGRRTDLYETHSPQYLFRALAALFAVRPDLRCAIQVVIAGSAYEKVTDLLRQFDLAANVTHMGWLSHEESMRLIQRSHVACLVLSRGEESEGWIPCKLYNYLGSGTPVLALVPDGDAAEIVRQTKSGQVVPPDDVNEIERAILSAYECYRRTRAFAPNWSLIEQYEARHLTGKLAECLNHASPAVC